MLFRSPAEVDAMISGFTETLKEEQAKTGALRAKVEKAIGELEVAFSKFL